MKGSRRTYRVVVTREGDKWLADVPELPGTQTFARNLPSLQAAVREAIALVEDLPDGAERVLLLDLEYHIGDPAVVAQAMRLREKRMVLAEEEASLARETESCARLLAGKFNLSVRDVAALLGVSPQRVSQVAPRG